MLSEWRRVQAGTPTAPHVMHYQFWRAAPVAPTDASKGMSKGTPKGTPKGTIVCVHGLTRNSHDFDRLAESLAVRGYNVVCPDIVGRGRSDKAADPLLYHPLTYQHDLNTLFQHERVKDAVWVGTSMGGILGMMLAAQRPRFVRKLILNDVGAFIPQAALERIAQYAGHAPQFTNLAEAEEYCRRTYSTFGSLSDADWKIFTNNSVQLAPGGAGYVMAYDPALVTAYAGAPVTDLNLWPLWQANVAPTLVVRGAESDLLPKDIVNLMLQRPHTDAVEFDNCGHAPSLMESAHIEHITRYIEYPHRRPSALTIAGKAAQLGFGALATGLGHLFRHNKRV